MTVKTVKKLRPKIDPCKNKNRVFFLKRDLQQICSELQGLLHCVSNNFTKLSKIFYEIPSNYIIRRTFELYKQRILPENSFKDSIKNSQMNSVKHYINFEIPGHLVAFSTYLIHGSLHYQRLSFPHTQRNPRRNPWKIILRNPVSVKILVDILVGFLQRFVGKISGGESCK